MTAGQLRAAAITGYVTGLPAEKRRRPGEGLVRVAVDGELAAEELVSLVVHIYNAGYQTTMSLLGNGLHLLLRHDPPVQSTGRHAAADPSYSPTSTHLRRSPRRFGGARPARPPAPGTPRRPRTQSLPRAAAA